MGLSVKEWTRKARETFPDVKCIALQFEMVSPADRDDYGRWGLYLDSGPYWFYGSNPTACFDQALAKIAGLPSVLDGEGEG